MQAGQARCDDQSEHQSLLALSSLCACRHARDVRISRFMRSGIRLQPLWNSFTHAGAAFRGETSQTYCGNVQHQSPAACQQIMQM